MLRPRWTRSPHLATRRRERYAGLAGAEAFDWDERRPALRHGEWYLVAFRSVRRPDADEARLCTPTTSSPTRRPPASPGFVHYFKGPTCRDGACLSFCLWESRAEARAAAGSRPTSGR